MRPDWLSIGRTKWLKTSRKLPRLPGALAPADRTPSGRRRLCRSLALSGLQFNLPRWSICFCCGPPDRVRNAC